jgi:uridylate kinase
MDSSAVSLMRDNNIPIVVFSLKEEGSLLKVLHGQGTSTTITNKGASPK